MNEHLPWPGFLSEWNRQSRKNSATGPRPPIRKYGNTIFHLEPNLKECPGGLRINLAPWFALLFHLKESKEWALKQRIRLAIPPRRREAAFELISLPPAAFLAFPSTIATNRTRSTGSLQDENAAVAGYGRLRPAAP